MDCKVKIPLENVGVEVFTEVRPFDIVSFVEYDGHFYHLHKEGFECPVDVACCSVCMKSLEKKQKPKLSVASGVDFGSYHGIGLTTPNIHETLIITRYRMYTASLKITRSNRKNMGLDVRTSMRGHMVFYLQDIESWVNDFLSDTELLSSERFKETIKILLLDNKRQPDVLMKKMLSSAELLARPWVLYHWFCVLRHVHGQFSFVRIPEYNELVSLVEEANNSIVERLEFVSDKNSLSRESEIGSDTTRTRSEVASVDVENVDDSDVTGGLGSFSSVGSSFLMNTPESVVTKGMFSDSEMLEKGVGALAGLQSNRGSVGGLHDAGENVGCGDGGVDDTHSEGGLDDAEDTSAEDGERLGVIGADNNEDDDEDFARWIERIDEHTKVAAQQRERDKEKGIRRCNMEVIGEMGTGDRLPSGAFPHVFMLNKVYGRPLGSTSREQLDHLFRQHTLIPSTCRVLQGYMCDCMQRFQVMRGVNVHVRKNARSIKCIQELMDNPEKLHKLTECIKNPKAGKPPPREAVKTAKELMGHLFFGGRDVSFGAVECNGLTALMMEAAKRFSCPSAFYTACIEDVNNPRTFRSSFHTVDNSKFPACFGGDVEAEDFLEKIKMCCEPERYGVGLDSELYEKFGYEARLKRAQSDPISHVREGRDLIYDVMAYLFGISLDDFNGWHDKKKTVFFMERKGVMGHTCFVIGVPEDHARGTLHYHFLVFGGLRPYVFQNFAKIHKVVHVVESVVDSMYSATIPEHHHLVEVSRDVISRRIGWKIGLPVASMKKDVPPLFRIPRPLEMVEDGVLPLDDVVDKTHQQCRYQNWHHHMKTCRKGKNGRTGCRLSMPSPPNSSTRPVELRRLPADFDMDAHLDRELDGTSEIGNVFEDEDGYYEVCCEPPTLDSMQYCRIPAMQRGDPHRAVVWELARPLSSRSSEFSQVPRIELHYESLDGKHSWSSRPTNRVSFKVVLDNHKVISDWLRKNVLCTWFSDDVVATWMSSAADSQLVLLYDEVVGSLVNANGYVAAYNPLLSLCTGAHNNVQFLGSVSQSKSAMAYLCPYLGKRKSPLLHSLVVLEDVINHVRRYPSTAEDSGTAKRTAVHVYQRLLNRLNLSIELSDYQVAAFLLNLPSIIRSCPFEYLNPRGCMDFSDYLKSGNPSSFVAGVSENDVVNIVDASHGGDEADAASHGGDERDAVDSSQGEGNQPVGTVRMFTIGGFEDTEKRKVLVPVAALYENRGEKLSDLSRLEYTAIVQVKRVTSLSEKKPPFPFKEGFVLDPFYQQTLRSKQCTVVVCSPQPRFPGDKPVARLDSSAYRNWKKKADAFARFVLVLFRPDTTECCLGYDWRDLEQWVDCLVNSNQMLSKFRLVALHRRFSELSNTISLSKMTSHYRRRCRDMWKTPISFSSVEGVEEGSGLGLDGIGNSKDDHRQGEEDGWEEVVFSASERKNMQSILEFDSNLMDALPVCLKEPRDVGPTVLNDQPGTLGVNVCVFKNVLGGALFTSDESYDEYIVVQRSIFDAISSAETPGLQDLSEVGNSLVSDGRNVLSSEQIIQNLRHKMEEYKAVLNEEQFSVYRVYCENVLEEDNRKVPPLALCHGPGGTGKTTLVKALEDTYHACGLNVVVTSFNHVNCLPFERSNTTYGMFHVMKSCRDNSRPDLLSVDDLTKLTTDYITKETKMVLVEEVSNQPVNVFARVLGIVQVQCSREHGCCIPILCIGDFGQLPPVKGVSIPRMILALLQHRTSGQIKSLRGSGSSDKEENTTIHREVQKVDSVYVKGADAFMKAKYVELVQQMRSVDEAHTQRVVNQMYMGEPLSSTEVYENYKLIQDDDYLQGDQIDPLKVADRQSWVAERLQNTQMEFDFGFDTLMDITRGFLVSDYEDLFAGLEKCLEEKDEGDHVVCLKDLLYCRHFSCSPWFETPILCGTNRSRLTLVHYQALNYARIVGQPVIRWPMQTRKWVGKPMTLHAQELAKDHDPGFFQYFVSGCKCYFTSTLNRANRPLKLVNASSFRLHSIAMRNLDLQCDLDRRIAASKPGDIISLDEPPELVRVAIHEKSLSDLAVNQLDQILSDVGGCQPNELRDVGYVVFPLKMGNHQGDDYHQIVMHGCPAGRFGCSKVQVRSPFKYNLGLTMTVNRSMGQTLPRIICALSTNPSFQLSYSHLYVVLSRVRKGADIRLLLNGETAYKKKESLFYIDQQKPDPSVIAMLEGFREGSRSVPFEDWHIGSGFDSSVAIQRFEELAGKNKK